MFKKTLLTAALVVAATGVASADGFYVGAGVGGSGLHSNNSYNHTETVDLGNIGLVGGLFGGYNFNFANQINLGVEAFGNFDSANMHNNASIHNSSTKLQYNYGLRFLPGYQLTADTDLHLLAGVAMGHEKYDRNPTGGTSASGTTNAAGFQMGFGSGTAVNSNFAVRGDIIYTGYKSKTFTLSDSHTQTLKMSSLDGVVSGEYKFG